MNFKNILVFRIGHLGDTLVTLPAFWALKNAFPGAKMTLLSNGNDQNPNYVLARNILPEKGLFDDWITYPAVRKGRRQITDNLRLAFDLRKRKFDAVFYLMTRNRTLNQIKRDRLFFRLAGISEIIGTRHLSQNLLDFERPRPLPRIENEAEFFLNCLRNENVPVTSGQKIETDLLLTGEEQDYADRWLQENVPNSYSSKDLVAVAPGSKWESKVWEEEKFLEVIGKLIKLRNIYPLVFGGSEDRAKGERLLEKCGRGANAAGQLNIRQAAAALSRCRLFIGNDSGTMHLAAAVKTPCVGIFAAIDWVGRWEPFGEKNIVLRTRIECEGCHLPNCPRNNECLRKITGGSVLEACLELLDDV